MAVKKLSKAKPASPIEVEVLVEAPGPKTLEDWTVQVIGQAKGHIASHPDSLQVRSALDVLMNDLRVLLSMVKGN